ncbi:actin-like protein arp8 [Lambiella insularis]|nr:actin-like protein arp8 [Lambiella insularis]
MVGKKSGKALLREEGSDLKSFILKLILADQDIAGLERTDNNMDLTTWPQVNMINQKNYYTEYLKRDDQILPLRLLQEERRNRMTTNAKDRDRALAQTKGNDFPPPDVDMDIDDEVGIDELGGGSGDQDASGMKVIVIHPGSQNLRIGLASDPLPKTVPMVIARRWKCSESEEFGGEPKPKRIKLDDGSSPAPDKMFGQEFASQYTTMCSELKVHMRANKRRVLPNSKELVVNYNDRTPAETISEHNDPMRIEWTELPTNPKDAPDFITGNEALRIPDDSNPRYKLFWPLQRGWYNEYEYGNKTLLFEDISIIIEEAIKQQLPVSKKKDWAQYGCVFVIPDLYERQYVIQILEMLMREFGFGRVCFIQESLAATFGAGYVSCCVVDIGAQKTSICCVEEGMCIENSRINLKYGGADVTDLFMKMMLFDHFPYADINLKRRYDYLLAEELKTKFCTLNEADISVQLFDFHLRAPRQDTRKYTFKTYDEVLLAPRAFFEPSIFDHSEKLRGRRKLIGRSEDLYDGSPNDPVSAAQSAVVQLINPQALAQEPSANGDSNGGLVASTPIRQTTNSFNRFNDSELPASALGSPAPEGDGTPAPMGEGNLDGTLNTLGSSVRDDVLPVIPLDEAILTSIVHGSRSDVKKERDFLGAVMVIGGGSQVPGFHTYLEERLKQRRPGYVKDIVIGMAPRELDPQGVIWKGASVFGKLRGTNDSWIGRMEYDRLGARLLAYKCMWAF